MVVDEKPGEDSLTSDLYALTNTPFLEDAGGIPYLLYGNSTLFSLGIE